MMRRIFSSKTLRLWLGLLFWFAPAASGFAASGCSYPSSLDTWADKTSGDNLTASELNARTCGLEKLMAGPIRPSKGSVSAPAFSFQGDSNTGVDSLGADQVSFIAGGAEIATATTSGLAAASGKTLTSNRTSCASVGLNLQSDGTCAGFSGSFGSIGQDSKNNAGTPNTKFDLTADAVILRNSSNEIIVRYNPGTITNDTAVAGSTANGRDQAGAFSSSSWVHLYWIWNGTTLATLSSATAPPTGPTLPSGYTHWSYAGAVRFDGSSNFLKTRIKGSRAFYEAAQTAATGAAGTTETTVSVSAIVPPNASSFTLSGNARLGANASSDLDLRIVSGSNFLRFHENYSANSDVASNTAELPNVGQQFFYIWGNAPSSGEDFYITAYTLPNGGR